MALYTAPTSKRSVYPATNERNDNDPMPFHRAKQSCPHSFQPSVLHTSSTMPPSCTEAQTHQRQQGPNQLNIALLTASTVLHATCSLLLYILNHALSVTAMVSSLSMATILLYFFCILLWYFPSDLSWIMTGNAMQLQFEVNRLLRHLDRSAAALHLVKIYCVHALLALVAAYLDLVNRQAGLSAAALVNWGWRHRRLAAAMSLIWIFGALSRCSLGLVCSGSISIDPSACLAYANAVSTALRFSAWISTFALHYELLQLSLPPSSAVVARFLFRPPPPPASHPRRHSE